jgi:hypothetical protein
MARRMQRTGHFLYDSRFAAVATAHPDGGDGSPAA